MENPSQISKPTQADLIPDRLERFVANISAGMKGGMENESQVELGKLIRVALESKLAPEEPILEFATIAASAVSLNPPNLKLAEEIRGALEDRIAPFKSPLVAVFRSKSFASRLVLGLGVLLYIAIPLAVFAAVKASGHSIAGGIPVTTLTLVGISGALGSIVSIMVRIQDFGDFEITDPSIPFLMGVFKPLVGSCFALFVYAALNSGIIPITVHPETSNYFSMAISFVAGFSERLARDLVTHTETRMTYTDRRATDIARPSNRRPR